MTIENTGTILENSMAEDNNPPADADLKDVEPMADVEPVTLTDEERGL